VPARVTGALIWPVDVPLVRVETVRAVIEAGDAAPGRLVIPQLDKRGGHPVRIPRARFPELMALDPARGLKALVEAQPAQVLRLPVDDIGVLVDIDTPEDFARLPNLK
jgi:CTP:molybdopterin cytidylyltransferase MocA